jgi:hypothetical protein
MSAPFAQRTTTLSPEHAAQRIGKVTASRIGDVLASRKDGKPSTARANYATELILERMTGEAAEHYKSRHMLRGIELEPDACAEYEWQRDCDLAPWPGGFVDHPTLPMCGASPDRYVNLTPNVNLAPNAVGLVEAKTCDETARHIDRLLGAPFENGYVLQAQWQLECVPQALWCDLASFDPRFPPGPMRLHVVRIERDEKALAELRRAVEVFLGEVETKHRDLLNRYGGNVHPWGGL